MSLLDKRNKTIKVTLYYKEVELGGGSKIVIIPDEEAEAMLRDEEKKSEVNVINTGWSTLSWKEHNDIMKEAVSIDPTTGQSDFDPWRLNDLTIKKCLKAWDIEEDGKKVAPNEDNIDRLPAEIVTALSDKYQKLTSLDENLTKKS